MDIQQNNQLVHSEARNMLIGSMIGIGIFNLASTLAKDAYEGAWVSAALGGVYPLYLTSLAIYIMKSHPSENILDLSKKYFGKIIGTTFNLVFMIFFLAFTVFVISGFSIIYQVFATTFLTPFRMISIMALISAFSVYKGLNVIGKLNNVAFYITVCILILNLSVLRKGSYLNLTPIFGAGLVNILKSTKESIFAYSGLEIIFIIYPSVKDNSKMGRELLKGVGITIGIYTATTVLTLYYLGADIIGKSYWPLITISESLSFTAINNFRIIFAFFWITVALKTSVNFYFASVFISGNILKKVRRTHLIGALYLIIVPITMMLGESTVRSKVIGFFIGKMIIFNLLYLTGITFFIFIKKDADNETKKN